MKIRNLFVLLLIISASLSLVASTTAVDTLVVTDFQLESFAKTIDFFNYARQYAGNNGLSAPPNKWHAYTYMTYVNTHGLRMLYAGLQNMTFDESTYFTAPMQNVMMHYKTNNRSREVLLASNFVMLLAFNETASTLYSGSPDVNDHLWSSFSMGFNFKGVFPNNTFPALSSETTIIPLTHSDDKLHWSWGMKYANLTAIWWNTTIHPSQHTYESFPVAITTYDELTFTYELIINPQTQTATLMENHVIGRMRQLWMFAGWLFIPFFTHYNSTGCYLHSIINPQGTKISDDTIHDFIQDNQIKMSIVDFQTSITLERDTYSTSAFGQNVTDADQNVDNSSITTYADDGEKLFDADFGSKQTYNLYNYTADPTETNYTTHDATARTCQINGFAQNVDLLNPHMRFMKLLPLLVLHMRSQMYIRARERIGNMSRANYFYIIGYPEYGGYKIEHDPTLTVYLDTTATDTSGSDMFNPQNLKGLVIIGAVAAVLIIAVALIMRRRKPATSTTETAPPQPPD